MAQRHHNRKQYFDEQGITTEKYVIPFISEVKPVDSSQRILEIGCGEGGNMKPFLKMGSEVVGVDINSAQLERAREYYDAMDEIASPRLIDEDIYKVDLEDLGRFDIIMLRDVIEHIPNQEKFMHFVRSLLKDDGVIFFGFPPWYMPFGGHQQMCKTKLGKLPWMHVLPKSLYSRYLKLVGENEFTIYSRMEIVDTQISIERFNRIVKSAGFEFKKKQLYFFNPNYEVKFGLSPKRVIWPFTQLFGIRNFYSTCYYSVIGKK